MSDLHPQLQQLEDQYNQLVDAVEAGHYSFDDALAVLHGTFVTDAAGAVWSINGDGDFVRSLYPGAPAEKTEPSQFAPDGAPAPQPHLTNPHTFPTAQPGQPAPFSQPAMPSFPTPAPFTPQQASPFGGGFTAPAYDTADTPWEDTDLDSPPSGFNPGFPSAATPIAPVEHRAAPAKSIHGAGAKSSAALGGIAGKAQQWVKDNKLFAAILVIGAIIAYAVTSQGGGSGKQTTLPTTAAGSSTAQSLAPLPTTAATTAASAPQLPSTADGARVISALMSCKENVFDSVLAAVPSRPDVLKAMAWWCGSASLHFAITPGPSAGSGKTAAVQDWTVSVYGQQLAGIHTAWSYTGGGWKLTAIPAQP